MYMYVNICCLCGLVLSSPCTQCISARVQLHQKLEYLDPLESRLGTAQRADFESVVCNEKSFWGNP